MDSGDAGRVAVITGAASGIGRACAWAYAASGAAVVCVDLDGDGAAETAQQITTAGRPSASHALDVRDAEATTALVRQIARQWRQIDVLVHCAGITLGRPFLELSAAEWRAVLATNLDGSFHVCQAVAQVMAAARRGAIVTLASVTGERAASGRAAYAASKGGVIMLTKAMAVELAPFGVRVNCIAPGAIETPLAAAHHGGASAFIRDAYLAQTPMARYGQPAEVARAALFLGNDAAAYITGHVLHVDGGFSAAGLLPPATAALAA